MVGDVVDNPPPRVTQAFFDLFSGEAAAAWVDDLDELASLVANGTSRVVVDEPHAGLPVPSA